MNRYNLRALVVTAAIATMVMSCQKTITEESDPSDPEPVQIRLGTDSAVMFTGLEEHRISLELADSMMAAYQSNNPYDSYAWFFSRKAFEALLSHPGAVGIRIYGGVGKGGKFSPVMFGVTADGSDIIEEGLSKGQGNHGGVGPMETAFPCPGSC